MRIPANHRPVTYKDLTEMDPEQLARVKSICYMDGRFRCSCTGIYEVKFNTYKSSFIVEWEDDMGGGEVWLKSVDQEIHNANSRGDAYAGLYIPINS